MRRPSRSIFLALGTAAVLAFQAALPHSADATVQPLDYSFLDGYMKGFPTPQTAPPGANDFGCRPSAAHPRPVVLVHGTMENMSDNWQVAAELLARHGYCVFALDYGGAKPTDAIQGIGHIADSAEQLAQFVDRVLAATGAAKVDVVGHSQGGLLPRYYMKFLNGAKKIGTLVGIAPMNHGTTLDGMTALGDLMGTRDLADGLLGQSCPACVEQEQRSALIASVNAGGETIPGVSYTVLESREDEVVTPYTGAFLSGPGVHDITTDDQCPQDRSDHLELSYDPVAMADMLNALDPAHPVAIPCMTVNPLVGPSEPVPAF